MYFENIKSMSSTELEYEHICNNQKVLEAYTKYFATKSEYDFLLNYEFELLKEMEKRKTWKKK